jgi:hypothetical protein
MACRTLPALLCACLAGHAVAATPWPDVKVEHASAFESSSSTSGVLRARYCFTSPTSVCVPAGSWVWFVGTRCGPRSGPGCDASQARPTLQAVDASAPITAEGVVFAAQAHRKLDADGEDDRSYSLQLEPGQRLAGKLHQRTVVAGLALAPGRVSFLWNTDDTGRLTLGEAQEGTTAEAASIGGWQVPAGTTFRRDGSLSLSLSKRAKPGAVFSRETGEPRAATSVFSQQAMAGADPFIIERLQVTQPLVFAGVSFIGEVTLARRSTATDWESASGTITAPLSLESFEVPAKSQVTWCVDKTLQKAVAPDGAFLTFIGRTTAEVRARRDPALPYHVAMMAPFERCDAGRLVGYDIATRRCPEESKWGRSFLQLTLDGKALEPSGQPFLDAWPTGPCPPPKKR